MTILLQFLVSVCGIYEFIKGLSRYNLGRRITSCSDQQQFLTPTQLEKIALWSIPTNVYTLLFMVWEYTALTIASTVTGQPFIWYMVGSIWANIVIDFFIRNKYIRWFLSMIVQGYIALTLVQMAFTL